jgi:hypothetical protein
VRDLLEILEAMAGRKADVPDAMELFGDMAERIVRFVVQRFGVKADEVAILLLTSDAKHLRFVAPRRLTAMGTIPVTKRDSIAVSVFQRKAGEAINNVPLVKHVAFFESVRLRDKPAPIQKMVTVPILHQGQAVGVAQISRKGDSPAQSGPDFTPEDVTRAQELFEAVAPYLMTARPERF